MTPTHDDETRRQAREHELIARLRRMTPLPCARPIGEAEPPCDEDFTLPVADWCERCVIRGAEQALALLTAAGSAEPTQEQRGYDLVFLVERGRAYWAGVQCGWTFNPFQACRYKTREDAEAIARELGSGRVVSHGFIKPETR